MNKLKSWFESFVHRYFDVIEVDEDGRRKEK